MNIFVLSKTEPLANRQSVRKTITQFCALCFNYKALLFQARQIQKLKTNLISIGEINNFKSSKYNYSFYSYEVKMHWNFISKKF